MVFSIPVQAGLFGENVVILCFRGALHQLNTLFNVRPRSHMFPLQPLAQFTRRSTASLRAFFTATLQRVSGGSSGATSGGQRPGVGNLLLHRSPSHGVVHTHGTTRRGGVRNLRARQRPGYAQHGSATLQHLRSAAFHMADRECSVVPQ